jgi:thiamine-phosphate pyrophosphorylase
MPNDYLKLMLVTHRQSCPLPEYLAFIEQCVLGGVSSVQLREKNASRSFLTNFAHQLKSLLDKYAVPLIINDDVELAYDVEAHGVHLGQTDGCPFKARECLGENKIIGVSIESYECLQQSNEQPIDYAAASAVFATSNKNNLPTLWGLDGLQSLCTQAKHPLIAIGGINLNNAAAVMSAGACGVAVIGSLHQANNPKADAMALRALIG